MIGHAVFDLDGTLVDSAAVCTSIMNHMLVDRGSRRRLTCADARPYMSIGGPEMIAALFGDDCGDPVAEIREFRDRYATLPTPMDSLYRGVVTGLARLRHAGVVLSICSNKPQNLCEKVLEDLGIGHCFSAIVGSSESMPKKPHPAMFEAAMARSGGSVGETCFIGDSEPDFEIARTVGVPFIFVGYGYAESRHFPDSIHCDDFELVPARVIETLEYQRGRSRLRMPRVA
jgi:phosphoglycolate phosphatase